MPFPLPPELLALTLEFVHRKDHKTIHSCALVSRTWCLHSRPHIFRHIDIAVSKPSTERWLERLTKQDLIPLILHVTLHGEKDSIREEWSQSHSDIPDWEIDVVEELGLRLTHVESLNVYYFKSKFQCMHNLETHLAFLKHLGSAKGGLRKLMLNQVYFARPDQLFHYLANVPGQPTELSVQHLYFIIADRREDSRYLNVTSALPPSGWQLTSLKLNSSELRKDMILWLISPAVDITRLQSLVIAGCHKWEILLDATTASLFEQLVVAIGLTVRKLTLEIGWRPDPPTSRFTAEVVKQFTALEQLFVESDYRLPASYALSRILSLLPGLDGNPSLTEIILALRDTKTADEIENIALRNGWDELDRELDGATLPGFRRLSILAEVVTGRDSLVNLENLIRAQMPRLLSRGLLEVRVEKWQWGKTIKF